MLAGVLVVLFFGLWLILLGTIVVGLVALAVRILLWPIALLKLIIDKITETKPSERTNERNDNQRRFL